MNRAVAPASYDENVLYAVRAFKDGKASQGQQVIVWNWLWFQASCMRDVSFTLGGLDGQRSSDFHQGRQFVAREMARLLEPEALDPKSPGLVKRKDPA